MIAPEQLEAFLDDALDATARAAIEKELERDDDALRFVIEQRKLDRLLSSMLSKAAHKQRVKESILAAVGGASAEQLRARVLANTSGQAGLPTRESSAAKFFTEPSLTWLASVLEHLKIFATPKFSVASAIALGLLAWLVITRENFAPAVPVGNFSTVIGQPTLRRESGRAAIEAQANALVHLGDRIETGDADRAEIQFNDGTTLRLGFSTTLEISNSKFKIQNSQLPPLRPPEINLLRGQIWTRVAKLTNPPPYAIRTVAATAVARGTEFGVKLQRSFASTNSQFSIHNSQSNQPLAAVLTVKEGAVDFTNSFGSVQATAMTESTARADSAPTEPKRLQTLHVVQVTPGSSWSLVTSPLALPDAAEKLAGGGGWAGLKLRDFASHLAVTNAAAPGMSNEVRVAQVFQASPAGRAGLQAGDVLLAFDGRPVTNANQVEQTILLRPNIGTTFRFRRGGEEQVATLTITNQAGILPGPTLSTAQSTQLANLTKELVGSAAEMPALQPANRPGANLSVENRRYKAVTRLSSSKLLQAAAQNNLGVIFESEDAFGPAIRAYGRAAYIAPEVPLYRCNLGLALRKIGSFERAEEELEVASRLAPASIEARKWLASTRSLLGRHEEALTETDAALVVAPRDHSLWELKSQLLTKQSRFQESLEAARRAVELDPNCPTAHAYLAGAFSQQGNLRAAEASYVRALELAPFDAIHHMDLGVVLRNRGQFDGAEQRLRRAIELRQDLIVAYDNLGLLYASTQRDAQAEETFRKALDVDPDNVEILRKLIYLAAESGRLDEAETRARKVLELAPHDSGSHNDLGEVYRQRGRFDEAIQSYRKALELGPDSPGVLNNIAIIQAMRGQHAEAEKTFRTLIELAAKDPRINPHNFLINLAMVCDKQGKLEDAETFYRQALALNPNDPGTCNSLAWFLADHRLKLDEALALGRRAVQTSPSDSNFLDTLGWVQLQRGELDEAEKSFKKALELAGENPPASEIREHLKKVAEKKGTPAK